MTNTISTSITPKKSLEILSQHEVEQLKKASENELYQLFRQCALAILHTGSVTDNPQDILTNFSHFDIEIIQQDRGIRLNLVNAPTDPFVDGTMIVSTREMLFSALRDIIYSENIASNLAKAPCTSADLTDCVFQILRNANLLLPGQEPNIVVCWGGHSINEIEYDYTKEIGHELGLRGFDICTGCGPGAMKGPMKGATIAHAKQRIVTARYIGLTEPGIIAAESPNPIVNELVILPDIEKRLEAFVRLGHGIIIFPGGAGTAEELLYLLGVLLHPSNKEQPLPIILTGPASSAAYFQHLHAFIHKTLGFEAQQKYKIIIDDPIQVAREMAAGIEEVKQFRLEKNDAYHFNWLLKVDDIFQHPFDPTHENMASLNLKKEIPTHELAANLRQAFSGIVAGNVKATGMQRIEKYGPYSIKGDPEIMSALDELLRSFVDQKRMKLLASDYKPCYEIKT